METLFEQEVIKTIERIVLNHGIAEVKMEKKGIVVVDVSRKIKYPDTTKEYNGNQPKHT